MEAIKEPKIGKVVDGFIGKSIDFLFKESHLKWIILITFLGFVLRVIALINLGVYADDMHHVILAINFIDSGKLGLWESSAALWSAITSIFYKLFGVGQLGSRAASLIFGTMSIPLIYLVSKKFFNEKTGIIAAFLLAISPFHVRNTVGEMDVMALFFILLGVFFFLKADESRKKIYFAFSGLFLGIAVLTKLYPILFVPVLFIYIVYKDYKSGKKIINKKNILDLSLFLLMIFLFCIPILANNYLLYRDKGFMDFVFTNALGMGKDKAAQYYSGFAGWNEKPDYRGLIFGHAKNFAASTDPTFFYSIGFVWFTDPLVIIFGIIGLVYCFTRKREYLAFFLPIFLLVVPLLASRILLPKHYLFLLIAFLLPAAYFLSIAIEFIKKKIPKIKMRHILLIILFLDLIILGYNYHTVPSFYAKSEIIQMLDFKKDVSSNSLFVADSRIYRGQIHWMLYGTNYVEASYLSQILQLSINSSYSVPTDVYFIECVTDDCGWGTVKGQPEFNKSMEDLVESFKRIAQKETIIYSTSYSPTGRYFPFLDKKQPVFRIYQTQIMVDPRIFPSLKFAQVWFNYPIGYDEKMVEIFDKYETRDIFGELIDKLAHLILYLAIVIVFISILLPIYLIFNEFQNEV